MDALTESEAVVVQLLHIFFRGKESQEEGGVLADRNGALAMLGESAAGCCRGSERIA